MLHEVFRQTEGAVAAQKGDGGGGSAGADLDDWETEAEEFSQGIL